MRRVSTWIVFLGLILTGLAQAAGMTLNDIARLQSVGQVEISPDGRYVAYTVSVPRDLDREDDGPAWSELYLLGPDGESRPFITGAVNVGSIGWRPTQDAISFLAKRGDDEQTALYAIPQRGGEAMRLASLPGGVSAYSFSPDGQSVALIGTPPVDEDVESLQERGFNQVIFEENLRERALYLLDLSSAANEPEQIDIEGSVQSVRWSPDGERLALAVTPRQLVDDTLMFKRIRIIDTDGVELGRVDNPGKLGDFRWSPDGDHLAMIATDQVRDPREGRLIVTDRDGAGWTHLMEGIEGHVWGIDWTDSGDILYLMHEGVETRIGQIAPDGDNDRTLMQQDGLIVGRFSASAAGPIALAASRAAHSTEVFMLDPGVGQVERMTTTNPWLDEIELARQTVFDYEARDGLDLQGLLVWPLDYREGERYPLILAAHGGPEAHYSNGWLTSYNLPAHHAAAQGYFMFYPNYRGSTGRGVGFTLSSQERPAKEEFSDLVDGVDALIEAGLVDGDRVGITGGSYGGYASAWAATYYTERFAAAVMNVGLSDKIAMFGTSDIPQELYLVHYRTWPWENWELFREASPIYYADQAQTPILILHGDADPRVHPTQSMILYRFLKLQDNPPPLRLVLYPGEGHGNRRAASRLDYSLRLMRWMNHYLKGDGGDPPPHALDYGLADES
jgi:dipeptidyl aminopeptidase/acylaminoacyl peptidase